MASETPNLFLAALSPTNCESLRAAAKVAELPIKATLYEPDSTPSYAYFLTSGLASIITPMANGDSGEVGFVGYEGIVGSLHLLGSARIPSRCVMQLAGKGLRIAFADLQRAFEDSEEIRRRILQFVQCEAAMTRTNRRLQQAASCRAAACALASHGVGPYSRERFELHARISQRDDWNGAHDSHRHSGCYAT
jgi:CRP-like cAMP-binding protein